MYNGVEKCSFSDHHMSRKSIAGNCSDWSACTGNKNIWLSLKGYDHNSTEIFFINLLTKQDCFSPEGRPPTNRI